MAGSSDTKEASLSPKQGEGASAPKKKSFQPTTLLAVIMGVVALGLALYAPAAQWWNSLLHARAVAELNEATAIGPEERLRKIREEAYAYNTKFLSSGDNSDYMEQLNPIGNDIMGRVKIPVIDVDLPIYHTSSDAVLRKGAGHMEETTLPVGGKATHAAVTAHRGLAESRLFTDLDKVGLGDRFTLEVAGDVLTYEVETVRIVKPTETDWLLVDPERDLVTLITCDPLGINTERMLVTGYRIFPTPIADLENANAPSDQPGIPWWMLAAVAGLIAIGGLVVWSKRGQKDAAEDPGSVSSKKDMTSDAR